MKFVKTMDNVPTLIGERGREDGLEKDIESLKEDIMQWADTS